jgi:hypothetical protein
MMNSVFSFRAGVLAREDAAAFADYAASALPDWQWCLGNEA